MDQAKQGVNYRDWGIMYWTLPPMAKYLKKSQPEIRGSLGERGGLPMMSRSGGLKPSAVAGRPSVTRLTHSSWTGIRASGRPRAAVRKILKERKVNLAFSHLVLNKD